MARYIDADKIDYKFIMVGMDENAGYKAVAFESDIDEMPTEDVAPKSEGDLYKKLNDELEDELASTYDKLENAKAEVAREIFEEIEKILKSSPTEIMGRAYYYKCIVDEDFAELKKKYTEDKT